MYFEDVVKIKEADCCEKCSSFEYDLPCRVDKGLTLSISKFISSSEERLEDVDKLFKSSSYLQIKKDEDTKVELGLNSRYIKLCAPKGDTVFKAGIEEILINWISDTLNIEIERS